MGAEKASVSTVEVIGIAFDMAIKNYETRYKKSAEKSQGGENKQDKRKRTGKNKSSPKQHQQHQQQKQSQSEQPSPNKENQTQIADQVNLEAQNISSESKCDKSRNNIKSKSHLNKKTTKTSDSPALGNEPASSRSQLKALSIHIKRQVWLKDQGQCSFIDPLTQQRCASKHRLEVDHIEAKALGGSDELDNLRLLCRTHNQLAAMRQFGFRKMEEYLN